MEDLAPYNHGCKAASLLITILANVVIFRLLTRDALGIGSVCVCMWKGSPRALFFRLFVKGRYLQLIAAEVVD